ncbi:MAG: hypothetical protein U1B78_03660 [Dehalococcoidia bacterium]|nr:hypothetical protein [Dehalococcoidia bacterium]
MKRALVIPLTLAGLLSYRSVAKRGALKRYGDLVGLYAYMIAMNRRPVGLSAPLDAYRLARAENTEAQSWLAAAPQQPAPPARQETAPPAKRLQPTLARGPSL